MKLFGTYTGTSEWNPNGNDPAKNKAWEVGVRAFSKNVGQEVNCVNVFPCWGSMQYWAGNAADYVAAGLVKSGYGTSMTPIIGLKMISKNSAPENYGWNDVNGYKDVAAGKWDSTWRGVVQAFAKAGFKYFMIRLAYEGNGSFMEDFMTWDAAGQAAWKAAWSHAALAMKDEAKKQGVRCDMVLNPNVMTGCPDVAGNLPDAASWDVLGVDIYNGYWGKGDVTSIAERKAFWDRPGGFGMLDAIDLAKKAGKPIFFCECGSGPSANGAAHGIGNDPAFWPWLGASVTAMRSQGVRYWGMCAWDIQPGDGSWRFADGTQPQCLKDFRANVATFVGDDAMGGTAGPAPTPAVPGVAAATGPVVHVGVMNADELVLMMSEDAYQGDAQFTVSVDGKQIGGTLTAIASHAAGQSQAFAVAGQFAAGLHTVSVAFLNDAYGGTAATDRNLYVVGAALNGAPLAGVALAMLSGGAQSFSFTK